MLSVGEKFPPFVLNGVNENNEFVQVSVDEGYTPLKNDWSVIYFYPKDFTFICPTEIVGMDNLMSETDEVYGISPDNEYCKWNWKTGDEHQQLYGTIHPLLADCNNVLAEELGIVNEDEGVPYRATYIVDPEGVIQHLSINALNTGRNANEILRTLQALKAGGLTGCEWNPGDDFVA